jgi:hypothetical protein
MGTVSILRVDGMVAFLVVWSLLHRPDGGEVRVLLLKLQFVVDPAICGGPADDRLRATIGFGAFFFS